MNTQDRRAVEARVETWCEQAAPRLSPGAAALMIDRACDAPQRGRSGWLAAWLVPASGVAAIVALAIVVGLGLSRLIGPAPDVGTPPPVVSPAPSSASPSASGSPEATVAPQGTRPGRIAFQANRANETSGIYLMDPDGGNVVALIDDPALYETDPVWSPDGSLLAYLTMAADGSGRGGVFVIDPDGGDPVQVDDAFAYAPPAWSPDGGSFALGGNGEASTGIALYDVAGGTLEQLTSDGGTAPRWSPDGTRIAYNVGGPNDVAVLDVATREITLLTDDDANDSVARWTDDGQRIVFVSDRGTDGTKGSQRSWTVDAAGGEPELLGDPVAAFAFWPSPDGAWLAYGAEDGLHLSRTDGSDDRLVQAGLPADRGPSWAPDSSGFVFSSIGEDPRELYLMPVDAAAPLLLTNDPADDSAPSWGVAP